MSCLNGIIWLSKMWSKNNSMSWLVAAFLVWSWRERHRAPTLGVQLSYGLSRHLPRQPQPCLLSHRLDSSTLHYPILMLPQLLTLQGNKKRYDVTWNRWLIQLSKIQKDLLSKYPPTCIPRCFLCGLCLGHSDLGFGLGDCFVQLHIISWCVLWWPTKLLWPVEALQIALLLPRYFALETGWADSPKIWCWWFMSTTCLKKTSLIIICTSI